MKVFVNLPINLAYLAPDLCQKIKSEDIMSPDYLVINCLFWDGTSDYYSRIINLAEDYLDRTEEPTVTGFNNHIIHNN